ncbi:MAG: hypothetical protein ACTSX8_10405 [Alphaproteobacteria bacterium]
MVDTKDKRRIVLAKTAADIDTLQAQLDDATKTLVRDRLKEKARHAKALRAHDSYRDAVLKPIQAQINSARGSLSEIRALYVPRDLVRAESDARTAMVRLRKGVGTRENELNTARETLKKLAKRDKKASRRLQHELATAENELNVEQAKLAESLHAYKVTRLALEKAEAEALAVPEGA